MATRSQAENERTGKGTLRGRRAFVVGGSGGIGRAVAYELARRGASLLIHGRTPAKTEACCADLRKNGAVADGFSAEILSPSGFLSSLPEGLETDILVVAFGPFLRKPLAEHSPAEWEMLALLDLALPGALASRFLPSMLKRRFGRVLLFGGSRTDSIRGYLSNAAYAAAKTGIGVLTKSIAAEGRDSNVAAVAICPGLVATEYLTPAYEEKLKALAPGQRLLDAAGVAAAAVDLIDMDPCAASGAIVSLDAGLWI